MTQNKQLGHNASNSIGSGLVPKSRVEKVTLFWEKDGKVCCMAVSWAMPLALTSREWAGLMAIKSHLSLSMKGAMEARGPALAHSRVPRASVGVAALWTRKDAPGNKLCSVKFDQPLVKVLSFPLWDINGLLALLEEGDTVQRLNF